MSAVLQEFAAAKRPGEHAWLVQRGQADPQWCSRAGEEDALSPASRDSSICDELVPSMSGSVTLVVAFRRVKETETVAASWCGNQLRSECYLDAVSSQSISRFVTVGEAVPTVASRLEWSPPRDRMTASAWAESTAAARIAFGHQRNSLLPLRFELSTQTTRSTP
jgi:hypothetical protein